MTKEGIRKILNELKGSFTILQSLSKIPLHQFMESREIQDRVKWNFYVIAQACLDLGNHVIAVNGFDIPEKYEDIITILEKKDIISQKISSSLRGMGGFRNLIAHGYFKLDISKLYGYLRKLKDVKGFLEKIEPYL